MQTIIIIVVSLLGVQVANINFFVLYSLISIAIDLIEFLNRTF